MANVWEFSPDAGTTKYDITDLQGRDDIDGINLAQALVDKTLEGSTSARVIEYNNSMSYIAKIEPNKTYIARKASGSGNRFRLILFAELPTSVATENFTEVIADATRYIHTFTNTTYKYAVLTVSVDVGNTDSTFKGMIYEAGYGENLPYRPYNQQSIQHQINDITGVTGVRNLLPNNFVTQTAGGITFTKNNDGTISLSNTTATGAGVIEVGRFLCKAGETYKLRGCPNFGSDLMLLRVGKLSSETASGNGTYDNGASYDGGYTASKTGIISYSTDQWITVGVNYERGLVAKGLTMSPMLRLISDPSDEYVPFAMTNRELTELFNVKHDTVTTTHTVSTAQGGNHLYKCGRVVQMLLALSNVTASQWSSLGTIPEEFRPIATIGGYSTNTHKPFFVTDSGIINIGEALSNNNINLYATWISKA